jgi:hypothetical protein
MQESLAPWHSKECKQAFTMSTGIIHANHSARFLSFTNKIDANFELLGSSVGDALFPLKRLYRLNKPC